MPIANFTTKVPCMESVNEIQFMLMNKGASAILIEYEKAGLPKSIEFRIRRGEVDLHFTLPANWRGVQKALNKDWKITQRQKRDERCQMIAWRIVRDWLRAQLALIEAGCADIEEVMLPYLNLKDGQTLYRSLANTGFKQLPSPQ